MEKKVRPVLLYSNGLGNEMSHATETNVIEFIYDSNSAPLYMVYDDTTYYYEKNLQGDITALLDREGNVVAEYTYDIYTYYI